MPPIVVNYKFLLHRMISVSTFWLDVQVTQQREKDSAQLNLNIQKKYDYAEFVLLLQGNAGE